MAGGRGVGNDPRLLKHLEKEKVEEPTLADCMI